MKFAVLFLLTNLFVQTTFAQKSQSNDGQLFQIPESDQYVYVTIDVENRTAGNSRGYRLFKGQTQSMHEMLVTSSSDRPNGRGVSINVANGDQVHFDPYDDDNYYKSPGLAKIEIVRIEKEKLGQLIVSLDPEIKFELRLKAVNGIALFPLNINWGLRFLGGDHKLTRRNTHCEIKKDNPVSIIQQCGVYHFTTSLSGAVMTIGGKQPASAQRLEVFVMTHGYGLATFSGVEKLKSCYRSLLQKSNSSFCPDFSLSDEGVKYTFTVKRIGETLPKAMIR